MDLNASPLELKQKADDLYAKQDYAAAAEEYRKLLIAQPGSTQVMKSLGLSLVLSKQADEGVQILQTAAAIQPADPEIRYAYGYGLGSLGRFDESISELDAALNLSPTHVPARQGLIFCLLTSGQAVAQVDPITGEQRLERAYKLDQRNAHVAHAFLNFLVNAGQKGKAINLIKGFDDVVKGQSPLKDLIEKLESNPEYQGSLKIASMSKPTGGAIASPNQSGTLKQIPCPACKLMIMDWVAICPHCNTKLKAVGTFANMDTGPKHEWQEIAYTILGVVWTLFALFDVWQSFPAAQKGHFADFNTAPFAAACLQGLIGIGLVCRQEWIAFLAKIFCYLRLGLTSIVFMITLFSGHYVDAGIAAVGLILTGMMIYLINYVID